MVLLLMVLLLGQSLPEGSAHTKIYICTFAHVCITPSGVMGSLWKDAYTSPQPPAGAPLPPPARVEGLSALGVSCSMWYGLGQQRFYRCHQLGGFCLFLTYSCISSITWSIWQLNFHHFIWKFTSLLWLCFSELWVCGPAAPASPGSL